MSKKEEFIDKMAAAIAKVKDETNKGVIKEHMINTVVKRKLFSGNVINLLH